MLADLVFCFLFFSPDSESCDSYEGQNTWTWQPAHCGSSSVSKKLNNNTAGTFFGKDKQTASIPVRKRVSVASVSC